MDGSIIKLCGKALKMPSKKQDLPTYFSDYWQTDKITFIQTTQDPVNNRIY